MKVKMSMKMLWFSTGNKRLEQIAPHRCAFVGF